VKEVALAVVVNLVMVVAMVVAIMVAVVVVVMVAGTVPTRRAWTMARASTNFAAPCAHGARIP
jgi:hypothetical protein